jgi:hypothetical protein
MLGANCFMADDTAGEKPSAERQVSAGPPSKKATRKSPKKKSKRATARKSGPKHELADDNGETGRSRTLRGFPASTLEESMIIADAIQKFAPGQTRVRKLTLFDKLGKTPDSGPSRQLITNSSRYGLTKGGSQAEFIEMTPEGALATGDDVAPAAKLEARSTLAIKNIEPFNFLYERCKGNKMPSKEFLMDALREYKTVEEDLRSECIDTFIINSKFLGLLRTIAGSERFITIEHALEEAGKLPSSESAALGSPPSDGQRQSPQTASAYDSICFYITPIGTDDSDQRKHSDFFMEYVVTPAVKEFNLKVVRADQIGKPGMIGKQVLRTHFEVSIGNCRPILS